MMTRPGGRKLSWAAVLLLPMLLRAVPLHAAEEREVPTDRLLPPGVTFYVTVPDWHEFGKRWNESLGGRLRKEPKMAEFWKELDGVWEKWSDQVKEKVGLPLEEILKIPEGEVSVAMVQLPGKPASFVVLLDYGDAEEAVNKLLGKAEDALEEQGAKRKETEKDETKIIVYTMPSNKEGDDAPNPNAKKKDNQVAYFQRDNWLAVGSDQPVLEAILARWDGEHKQTFADNEVYQYILERCQPSDDTDAALVWYMNPIDLVKGAVQQAGQGNFQLQLMLGLLPQLGLDKFKAIGGAYDMSTEDFDAVSRTLFYVNQPTEGVLNVFQFPATTQAPPKWVPATASTWYGVNWDIAGAYDAIEKLVDTFQGQGTFAKVIDDLSKKEQGPKLHIKKDFIDLLSGHMDLYTEPAKEDDDETPDPQRLLMAFGVKNVDKMKGTLSKLAAVQGFPAKPRDFEGATIYEFSRPGAAAEDGKVMGMTVANGGLLASTDVTLLEQALRSDKDRKSLADDPEYQQIARKFPAKASIVGFQRQDEQFKPLYEMLKSGQTPIPIGEDIDFSKLPDFEVIKKYLPPTGSYAEPDKNGALMVGFTLKERRSSSK